LQDVLSVDVEQISTTKKRKKLMSPSAGAGCVTRTHRTIKRPKRYDQHAIDEIVAFSEKYDMSFEK
jgi:hypothetical protein